MTKKIIDWFKTAPRVREIGNYFSQDKVWSIGNREYAIFQSGQYYQCEMDAPAVTVWINQCFEPIAKKNAISAIDKADQHALHYVLQNDLCPTSDDKYNTLARSDVTSATQDKNTAYRVYINHFHEGALCAECSTLYSGLNAKLDESKRDYQTLESSGKLHSAASLIKQNKPSIIKALIEPFADDDADFTQLLSAHDKKGNTPLFYAYTKVRGSKIEFKPLLDRIGNIKLNQHKWDILQVGNYQNKSIIHAMVANYGNLDFEIASFGTDLIKNAMCLTDNNGNTPFHEVLLNTIPLSMVESMCKLFSATPANQAEEEKNKHDFAASFCQNKKGFNPLHLLCQLSSENPDTNTKIFDQWQKILPLQFLKDKLIEEDNDGCTPLHHAIKSGNNALVRKIFEVSNSQKETDKKEFNKNLAWTQNKRHQSALHHACRFGSVDTVNRVIDALGPKKLYEIRYQTNLYKLIPSKHHFSVADLESAIDRRSYLFNCFHYFDKNHPDRSLSPFSNAFDFHSRVNDFCNSLIIIETALKEQRNFALIYNTLFNAKTHFLGIKGSQRYADLKVNFKLVTNNELKEFLEFITEKAITPKPDTYQNRVAREMSELLNRLRPAMPALPVTDAVAVADTVIDTDTIIDTPPSYDTAVPVPPPPLAQAVDRPFEEPTKPGQPETRSPGFSMCAIS